MADNICRNLDLIEAPMCGENNGWRNLLNTPVSQEDSFLKLSSNVKFFLVLYGYPQIGKYTLDDT